MLKIIEKADQNIKGITLSTTSQSKRKDWELIRVATLVARDVFAAKWDHQAFDNMATCMEKRVDMHFQTKGETGKILQIDEDKLCLRVTRALEKRFNAKLAKMAGAAATLTLSDETSFHTDRSPIKKMEREVEAAFAAAQEVAQQCNSLLSKANNTMKAVKEKIKGLSKGLAAANGSSSKDDWANRSSRHRHSKLHWLAMLSKKEIVEQANKALEGVKDEEAFSAISKPTGNFMSARKIPGGALVFLSDKAISEWIRKNGRIVEWKGKWEGEITVTITTMDDMDEDGAEQANRAIRNGLVVQGRSLEVRRRTICVVNVLKHIAQQPVMQQKVLFSMQFAMWRDTVLMIRRKVLWRRCTDLQYRYFVNDDPKSWESFEDSSRWREMFDDSWREKLVERDKMWQTSERTGMGQLAGGPRGRGGASGNIQAGGSQSSSQPLASQKAVFTRQLTMDVWVNQQTPLEPRAMCFNQTADTNNQTK
ncbi:hypothetical protein BT96DRAFT_945163 [Gymnopus androsaceus JB14]|uniref:Uncharacterized protein n=1 Tax=Gymnopus androsaceus JB14 TaxID=1447944 RepID=A0A6A4H207_9AGAR|nr:hypothetical protein BT96DRAFT_945163 [Gymnopus androsaceus JB14]